MKNYMHVKDVAQAKARERAFLYTRRVNKVRIKEISHNQERPFNHYLQQ